MTFARNLSRSIALGALAMGLTFTGVRAQNGSNFHILANGLDAIYGGIGAGGTQTKADGLGTWVAGENMRGSHMTLLGDWGYRNIQWREFACPIKNPVVGPLRIWFNGIFFIELDGLNGNNQVIFLDPTCPVPGPSFPLGSSGFIPYGTIGSGSFLLSLLPAGAGPAASSLVLLPNNGLQPSSLGGAAILLAAASQVSLGINSSGFCWGVQFTWIPSALSFDDDIDGFWHYVLNSPDGNQYWGMSNDEMNIWQGNSLLTDSNLAQFFQFVPSLDYDMQLLSVEPNTIATLAPRGVNLSGAWYMQTENVSNQVGASVNPNGGFDAGRGSDAISFSGTAGVANPATGVGNQNAANNPGTVTTLGFMTFDNVPYAGGKIGSVRLTWVSIDFAGFLRTNPDVDAGISKFGGAVRVPMFTGPLQPITSLCFNLFQHVTRNVPSTGIWPDVDGFGGVAPLGVHSVAAASWQFPTGPQPAACIGVKVNLTYGTSGRTGGLGTAGPLTWDPSIADVSGTKQLFLFN